MTRIKNKDMFACDCKHDVVILEKGGKEIVVLYNTSDVYYSQVFKDVEELDDLIDKLQDARIKVFCEMTDWSYDDEEE